MKEIELNQAEKDLCSHAKEGKLLELGPEDAIHAEVIRRLVLGLPFDKATGLIATISSFFDDSEDPIACSKAVAGIRLKSGIIKDRLDLHAAAGADGGPLCPLEFHGCRFEDGFSGAHGRFARLSLRDCTFEGPERAGTPAKTCPTPTIDLTGADFGSDLDMCAIRPFSKGDLLWIRAPGITVEGSVNLSRCCLRAPASKVPRHTDEPAEEALNLMLAEIKGELLFLNGNTRDGGFSLGGAKIGGDVWLSGADVANPGDIALFLQSTRIDGILMMTGWPELAGDERRRRGFHCVGKIKLEAAIIGCSLYLKDATVEGDIEAPCLSVRDDVLLAATVRGAVKLRGCRIGGSLDLSGLRMGGEGRLSLLDGTIGRVLRIAWDEDDNADRIAANPDPQCPSDFNAAGVVDLRGLTCDTLDDRGGLLWRRPSRIKMNHFVYRQATWEEKGETERKPSDRRFRDWARSAATDRMPLWLIRLLSRWFIWPLFLHENSVQWASWQIRRNWIYRQFKLPPALLHPARHKISESEYHSQPFEQAVRVARAEGREDIATRFEMLKFRIEWRLFNLRIRWLLAPVAITVAAGWLVLKGGSPWLTFLALAVTWAAMLWVSTTHRLVGKSRVVTGLLFYAPALLLFLVDGWWAHPFHFVVALFIYLGIRFLSVLAHFAMRAGFGYLRRPGRAIVTLIAAFLFGWWGVHHANERNMLVIAAAPVASTAAPLREARYPVGYRATGEPAVMGSRRVSEGSGFAHELSCAATASEPLYALDVLIPIVDLGEERLCEIRRLAEPRPEPAARASGPPRPEAVDLGKAGGMQLLGAFWPQALDDHRFWWWMKALYAIAGWIIVSLSLLTFAQANRTHAEPPEGKH